MQGLTVKELFGVHVDNVEAVEGDQTGLGVGERKFVAHAQQNKGKEVDQVPLCVNCMVEVEVGELDEETLIEKGLSRVDRTDGGLSRRRWEAWGESGGGRHQTSSDVSESLFKSLY